MVLIWSLSIRGSRACVYLHDKLKFIENGFHIHSSLRFRYWSFYRFFASGGSHLFTSSKFSFEGTQYFHFLWVTRCPYLSNKIGFMSFGVRMNFLCQFCFGGFLVTFSPETPVCPHRRLRSLLGTKGPETPVSADRRLRSGLCSLPG